MTLPELLALPVWDGPHQARWLEDDDPDHFVDHQGQTWLLMRVAGVLYRRAAI